MTEEKHSDEYWRERLTDDEYRVMRERGTEAPFTGEHLDNKEKGMYRCKACGAKLFNSDVKFESGTGWPSFSEAIPGAVNFDPDDSYGMRRIEVTCANCGGHLGHIFDDGPEEKGGKRYCINSVCLAFDADTEKAAENKNSK